MYSVNDYEITIKEITYGKYKSDIYTVVFEAEFTVYPWFKGEKYQKIDLNILEFKDESLTIKKIKKKCAEKMVQINDY